MDSVDSCIAGLYRASSGEEPWSTSLERVTREIDGLGTQFVCLSNGALTFSRTCGSIPPEAELEYVQRYHAVDPRIPHLLAAHSGEWLFCQDLFRDRESEAQSYYRDLLIPYGGRYSATMKVAENKDETVLIALLSRLSRGRFDDGQKDVIRRLGGHLVEAISRFRRVRALATGALVGTALIQRLRKPVILVDAGLRVTTLNAEAEQLMRETEGPFRVRDGCLHVADKTIASALREFVGAMAAGNASALTDRFLTIPDRWRDRYAGMSIAALLPDSTMRAFGDIGQVMVTAHPRRSQGSAPVALWQAAFGLTPAEAKLAAQLWDGNSVKEASRSLGVAISTSRSQIVSILRKTGTSRQSEMLRVLGSIAEATPR